MPAQQGCPWALEAHRPEVCEQSSMRSKIRVRREGGGRWVGFPVGASGLRTWGRRGNNRVALVGGVHMTPHPCASPHLPYAPRPVHSEGTLEQGQVGAGSPLSKQALDCSERPEGFTQYTRLQSTPCVPRSGRGVWKGSSLGDPGEAWEEGGTAQGHPGLPGRAERPCGQDCSNRQWGTVLWCWGTQSLRPHQEPQRYRKILFSLKLELLKTP